MCSLRNGSNAKNCPLALSPSIRDGWSFILRYSIGRKDFTYICFSKGAWLQLSVQFGRYDHVAPVSPPSSNDTVHYAVAIVQEVYEEYTGVALPDPPLPAPSNGRMPRHNAAGAATTNADYYPQVPPPFVPASSSGQGATGARPNGVHPRSLSQRLQQRHDGARPAAGGAHTSSSIICPCGSNTVKNAEDLIMCQTCKRAGFHKLQHAAHMGYVGKVSAKDREKYMCDKCRVTYADPFWRDSTAPEVQDPWLLHFTFVPAYQVSLDMPSPSRYSLQHAPISLTN